MNQLLNKQDDKIFPITHFTQVFDAETNRSLQDVITQVNSYFIPFYKNSEETRASIPMYLRRKGLQITYLDQKNKVQTEVYNSNKYEDEFFIQDKRWIRSNTAIGTKLSISAEGNWLIDEKDTGISIYPSEMDWKFINNKPTKLSQFENDVPFAKQKHTHTISQVEYLQEIIDSLQLDVESLQGTASGNDKRYASKEIQKAVQNIQDSNGNSLFNKDGIVIPRDNGSDGQGNQVFTDRGVIEKILRIDGNEFTVKLRQRWEGDFTSFQKDDIIKGVVSSPTTSGEYYTAWARIVDINRYANEIKLVHYNNSEVPENTNYDITKNMIIHRFGNATDTERQSIQYISSTEGRIVFLTGVTKPILEDYNYASFWGNPLPLKVFEDKPINMNHPYAYMRGLLVQDLIRVDYNGVPIKDIVNSGPWIKGKVYNDGSKSPYIQHEVYHNGVLWRCIIDNSTEEPTFDSSQWAVMSDNTRFSVELYTDAPLFYRPNTEFKYNLVARVFHGTEDITDKMVKIDCRWERNTRNINKDNAWNSLHSNSTNLIEITQEDVGIPENGVTIFKCEVYIKDGDNLYKINKQIEL